MIIYEGNVFLKIFRVIGPKTRGCGGGRGREVEGGRRRRWRVEEVEGGVVRNLL